MVGGPQSAHFATFTISYLSISSLLSSHPSLIAPIPSLRPMCGSGNGLNALSLVLIECKARQKQQLVMFGGVLNSNHFQSQLQI